MLEIACPGCGATVLAADGPSHPYLPAAPGCWALYCGLQPWYGELRGEAGITTIQDLVDAYAAQHAASSDRRNRQSVAVHLMSLCLGVERGASGRHRRSRIGGWTHRPYPLMEPLPVGFILTVADISRAPAAQRAADVARMAVQTWAAWAHHHPTVRRWLDEAG